MKSIKCFVILFMLVAVYGGVQAKQPAKEVAVKNVILMIGDGMGLAHTYITMLKSEQPMAIERAQYVGLSKTYSANNRVTDSAASGTAMATGVKTNNGAIGVDKDKNSVQNLTELAYKNKLATGIVVTCDVTHATPSAFYAHEIKRDNQDAIAVQLAAANVDVVIGGGKKRFVDRADNNDLVAQLEGRGYKVAYTLDDVKSVHKGKLIGLLADEHMSVPSGDYLATATEQALKILSANSPKGFFMMVEGSQIDFEAHGNKIQGVMGETADFDLAVKEAFDFADKNPGTLVIVTADHETGGLTIPSGKADFLLSDQGIEAKFSTKGHTGVMVPIYSYGTGSEKFSGIMENTQIYHRIVNVMNLK